jgi:hypothetical protein
MPSFASRRMAVSTVQWLQPISSASWSRPGMVPCQRPSVIPCRSQVGDLIGSGRQSLAEHGGKVSGKLTARQEEIYLGKQGLREIFSRRYPVMEILNHSSRP